MPPTTIEQILARIDDVRRDNRGTERLYIILTTVLFLVGIGCLAKALVEGQYVWAIPPVFTTGFLYWPLREIKDIRRKNIALACAPILIMQLPTEIASIEIQKLLIVLYEERNEP